MRDCTDITIQTLTQPHVWWRLGRVRSTHDYQWIVLLWSLIHASAVVAERALGAPVYPEPTIVLDALCCYVLVPNRLLFRIIPAVVYTVGDVVVTVMSGRATPLLPSVVLTYAFVHGVGLWASVRLFFERRQRFAASHVEAEMRQELARLAHVDTLTGVSSRQAWFSTAEAEFVRLARYGGPLALLMADLDHFKAINDTLGHGAGDAVLARFGELLRAECREVDHVGRIGGEEFAVVLPHSDLHAARAVAERLINVCSRARVLWKTGPIHFSCSIGVAEARTRHVRLEDVLEEADAALYTAKRSGRAQVCVTPGPVTPHNAA